MKRTLKLISLGMVLMLTGCSVDPGVVNPFPDDTYQKIGLNSEFTVNRSATAEELYAFDATTNGSVSYTLNKYTLNVEVRDYTLSRTGVFKNGYDVFDVKASASQEVKLYNNLVIHTNSKYEILKRYEYANEFNDEVIDTYDFCDLDSQVDTKYDVYKVVQSVYNDSEPKITKETNGTYDSAHGSFASFSQELNQLKLITELGKPIGVDKNNCLIFATENNLPYNGDGLFVNKSGEKFRAMTNVFVVASLTPFNIEDDMIYILKYYRKYTETIITSKALQPNARIEYLENPILINYTESITSFDIDADLEITDFDRSLIPEPKFGGNN